MDAAFSRVLNLQRDLYTAEVQYLHALEGAQTSYVALDGFLYSGGLELPQGADPAMRNGLTDQSSSGTMRTTMPSRDLNSPNAQSSIFDSGMQP